MSAGNVAVVDSWAILAFLRAEEPGAAAMRRESLVLEAARVKAAHSLSYADAFAVATGRVEKAPVITGDPQILALPATVVRVRRLDRNK